MRELTDFILKDELIPIQKKRPESIVGMALKVDCICNLNHELEGFLILLQKQKTKIELDTRIKH